MTRPTTTGKAQDLITFTRSTTGTALAKISYGEELVTNGDFSSDSNWNKNPNWTISNGAAISDGSTSQNINQGTVTSVVNKPYLLSVTLSSLSQGSVTVTFGGAASLNASSTGTHSLLVIPSSSDRIRIYASDYAIASIDNVSIKEVLYDQPDGTLQLFNHPINKPRIEYDAEGNCLGLLVEEGRTNLVTQSEFASGYGNHYLPLTRNQTASPDTNINAASAVPTAVNTEHYLEYVLSSPSSGTYTQSVFVKANGYSKVALTPVHVGADQGATSTAQFDLTEGTSTQSGSAVPYISNLGNGWYRIAITYTATGTVTNHRFRVQVLSDSYGYVWQANGADGIYVYGAQLETGSFPTSYIPTSGSAVTRSADVASLAVSEFGYNQDQGSVVVKCSGGEVNGAAAAFNDGSAFNSIMTFWVVAASALRLRVYTGNAQYVSIQLPFTEGEIEFAAGLKENNFAASSNGVLGTDTDGLMPLTATTTLNIGAEIAGASRIYNGHIKSIQYYPLRLSNAQLQALTS